VTEPCFLLFKRFFQAEVEAYGPLYGPGLAIGVGVEHVFPPVGLVNLGFSYFLVRSRENPINITLWQETGKCR